MKVLRSILLVIVSLLLLVSPGVAAQVEFHPQLSAGREYTNNLFLTDRNKETDWISTVAPGIVFNYQAPSVDLALDYSLNFKFYQNHNDQNLDNFADVQRTNSTLLFFSGRPFTLSMTGDISRESLDDRDISSPDNDLVNMFTVYHLTVAPEYQV